ncbi:hypothetical protein [Propionibacterium sp.]|uniref:hypothetical protein n=1 Tax=Propionibacterium sp. TaxID=1977903 RepID=UPI0039E8AEDD
MSEVDSWRALIALLTDDPTAADDTVLAVTDPDVYFARHEEHLDDRRKGRRSLHPPSPIAV